MQGMSATTGKPLAGEAHLQQSVNDILLTPIGTRVGRREYGSELSDLIDQPMTPRTRQRLFAATAMALLRWEPRLRLLGVTLVAGVNAGAFVMTLDAQRLDVLPPARTRLEIPLSRSPALA